MNDIFDKMLDEYLDEAAKNAAGASYGDENDADVEFSQMHEAKMERFFAAQRKKQSAKKYRRILKAAACVLLAVAVGSGVTIFSVDALRTRFLNFVFDPSKPNTDYNFSDYAQNRYFDSDITLNYIPEGFKLADKVKSTYSTNLKFMSDSNMYFQISATDIDVNSNIDTENATIEAITINGYDGVYISKDNINVIVWHDNRYSYTVVGNISKENIIKIAKNLKK